MQDVDQASKDKFLCKLIHIQAGPELRRTLEGEVALKSWAKVNRIANRLHLLIEKERSIVNRRGHMTVE